MITEIPSEAGHARESYARSWQRPIASEWFAYLVAGPSTKGGSMGDDVLCIGLLAVFSISAGDSVIAEDAWRLRKARTLIKLLALAPERRLHVDQAAELLWAGRDPDSARNPGASPRSPSPGWSRERARRSRLRRSRCGCSSPGRRRPRPDSSSTARTRTLSPPSAIASDGMPQAIELAAARVSVLTPAQIVERLDDSLDLLSAGPRTAMTRQQTLRATLAWSFELLGADEQVLLRRLAVFAGGFGLEAAETIGAEDPLRRSDAVAVLDRLIDKSLVHVDEGSKDRRRDRTVADRGRLHQLPLLGGAGQSAGGIRCREVRPPAQAQGPLRPTNLFHLNQNIPPSKAVAFFVDLGLELQGETPVEGDWVDRIVGLEGVQAQIAMLQTPDGHGRLELTQFQTPPADGGNQRAPANASGIRHVAFAVEDIDDVVARLQARGAKLVGELGRYKDIYRLCYVRGPEGIIVELAERIG